MIELVRREVKFNGPLCVIEAKDLFTRICEESISKEYVGSRVHFCEGHIVFVYEDRQYAHK